MNDRRSNGRGFLLSLVLVLAAGAALAVDMPIARGLRACHTSHTSHSWLGYFDFFETFGHGFGVFLILLTIHQLDPVRRWAIPRVLVCTLASGGLADLLKMLVLRIRPYECDLSGTLSSTFEKWLPLLQAGSPGQSFPSAHTATAAGFAAALIWLYPQGRYLFTALAVLVGCQRMVCGAHYLSDVLVGAAAGCLVAPLFLYVGLIPKWFARFEARWRNKRETSVTASGHRGVEGAR
jgi:membrane-associated phospholipid phosphatase